MLSTQAAPTYELCEHLEHVQLVLLLWAEAHRSESLAYLRRGHRCRYERHAANRLIFPLFLLGDLGAVLELCAQREDVFVVSIASIDVFYS